MRRINEAILSGEPQSEILELIASRAAATVHARLVMIGLVDSAAGCIRIEAGSGSSSAAFDRLEIPIASSKCGLAIQARRTVRIDDARADSQYSSSVAEATDGKAVLIIPLIYRDQAEGVVLAIDSLDRPTFNDDDQHVLELFAARATLALGMARSLQAERERAAAEVMLLGAEQREQAQRETLRRVVEAQESERRRIARELHDDTGQSLASVLMGLRSAENSDDLAETRRILGELRETIAGSIRDLRALAVELRPTALDDFGLRACPGTTGGHLRSPIGAADRSTNIGARRQTARGGGDRPLSDCPGVAHERRQTCRGRIGQHRRPAT